MINKSKTSRRDFLKTFSIGAASIKLGLISQKGLVDDLAADPKGQVKSENRNYVPGMKYRMYGKTGLMLSVLGIGGVGASGWMYPPLIDAGLNYVQYYGDDELPNLLKDKKLRDRLYIIGGPYIDVGKMERQHFESPQAINRLVDRLLKKLNIEQLDILCAHIAGYDFLPDYLLETKNKLIKAGKIRFLTSSDHNLMPHGNPEQTIGKFSAVYDGFLGGFNFLRGKTLPRDAFTKHKIGIITFKPMQGLRWTSRLKRRARKEGIVPQEAAVHWLLSMPEITSVVRLISNRSQLESNLRAIKGELSDSEKQYLDSAALAMASSTCDLCGTCSEACPNGVSAADIQRCRLYAQGFGDIDRASHLYHSLGSEHSALACLDCGTCEQECPKHLPIRESLAIMHKMLNS